MSTVVPMSDPKAEMQKTFDRAMQRMDECDGVVILMQKKASGFLWFAPTAMRFETLVFYLWTGLTGIREWQL